MTTSGPEPLEVLRSRIDYEHYLSKQLQPIADSILLPLHDNLTTARPVLGRAGQYG
jgi:DNA polymerase-2